MDLSGVPAVDPRLDDATAKPPEAKRTLRTKAEIASHILACAAKGERDPVVLKMAALSASVECTLEGNRKLLSETPMTDEDMLFLAGLAGIAWWTYVFLPLVYFHS
jgi:hypothetical protein